MVLHIYANSTNGAVCDLANKRECESSRLEALLVSPDLSQDNVALQRETASALTRHNLTDFVEIGEFIVDRLEDEDFAVILMTSGGPARLFPRFQLRAAGLDREKVRGMLLATRTTDSIVLDVWPAVEANIDEDALDPELPDSR